MMKDIKALAKKADPFASFALIIAAVTLIFAGTTTIIGNGVRDSIIDCNTEFGQSLIDSLTPRTNAQTELENVTKKYLDAENHVDVVTLDLLKGKITGDSGVKKVADAYAAKAALYLKVQAARKALDEERRENPYPTPPTSQGCNVK